MSDTRAEIRKAIEREPGIHFSGLVRRLSLGRGQTQHHLGVLVDAGTIERFEYRGRSHLYPTELEGVDYEVIALLRRETTAAIVTEVLEAGAARPATLTERLSIPRSTLEYHLETLEAADLTERKHRSGNAVEIVLTRPAETREALDLVSRSALSAIVDRFERLLDGATSTSN